MSVSKFTSRQQHYGDRPSAKEFYLKAPEKHKTEPDAGASRSEWFIQYIIFVSRSDIMYPSEADSFQI